MSYRNLSCDQFNELASEYVDATLADGAVADADLHLAACESCQRLVADLREVARAAADLPSLAPSRDLWAGIESRIQPSVLAFVQPQAPLAAWWSNRARLGAAAAALVAVTALGTDQLTRQVPASGNVAAAPIAAPAQPLPRVADAAPQLSAPTVTAAQALPVRATTRRVRPEATATYDQEIGRLRDVLELEDAPIDPTTKAVIESSVRTIDSAIAEARAALSRDPASGFLTQQLNKSLERKLGLLRTAARLASST